MKPFDFQMRTRMVSGENSLDKLGKLAAEQFAGAGVGRALLVTDPGIIKAGHVDRALESLRREKIDVQVFDGTHENPTTEDVAKALVVATEYQPELLIGLGGGSSMDCAKGVNFVYSCGGTIGQYAGVGLATAPMLPMIAVPTTAGTGSEMQSFALISDAKTHVKMACGDKKAACRVAILDPLLTLTQPPLVTALTGIDAISHAIETMVTKRWTRTSRMFSVAAWELLADNFSRVMSSPDDVSARSAMQLGAAWAGLAIENSMLGASHALANPLTARFDIPHGQAVGMMLPHVIRFNGSSEDCQHAYAELLSCCEAGKRLQHVATSRSAGALADLVSRLVEQAGLKLKLSELGVAEDAFPALADEAAKQWTGTFNPVDVDETKLLQIYRNAA